MYKFINIAYKVLLCYIKDTFKTCPCDGFNKDRSRIYWEGNDYEIC